MTGREEVVKTLTHAFAVQIERWDDHHYPYQHTESLWEDHLQAADSIAEARENNKRRIVLRHLNVLSSGRIVWHDIKTVWQAGEWVSGEHDPRCANPRYREYLKLKKEFEND